MLGLPFQLDLQPSFYTDFAHNEFESEYPQLWPGLIGAWVSAMGVTGSTLFDLSGFGHNGTLIGMEPTDWIISGDSRFPGYTLDMEEAETIDMGDHSLFSMIDGSGDLSFTIVVRAARSSTDASHGLLLKQAASIDEEYFFGYHQSDRLYGSVADQSASAFRARYIASVSTWVPINTFHDAAMTYDGTAATNGTASIKVYVDGIRRDDNNFSTGTYVGMEDGPLPLEVGDNTSTFGAGLAGQFSYALLWKSRVLTASELLLLNRVQLAPFILRSQLFVKAPAAAGTTLTPTIGSGVFTGGSGRMDLGITINTEI